MARPHFLGTFPSERNHSSANINIKLKSNFKHTENLWRTCAQFHWHSADLSSLQPNAKKKMQNRVFQNICHVSYLVTKMTARMEHRMVVGKYI